MEMSAKTKPVNVVKQIRKATAKKFSAEDKIRIVVGCKNSSEHKLSGQKRLHPD